MRGEFYFLNFYSIFLFFTLAIFNHIIDICKGFRESYAND